MSRRLVYDDLFVDEVETPQTTEAPQPKMMVMLGPRYPEDGFTFDQEIVETPKAPHNSSVCIEDQSHTQIMLPPLKLHDTIVHALEKSYIESTCARCKLYLFMMFAFMSYSRVCVCLTTAHSVSQHQGKSTDTCHALALTYVQWTHLNSDSVCLH